MWYSRLKLAISKDEAERIIQEELSSRSFVDPATDDENIIKQKLIDKYGSEEEMISAINSEVAKIMNEFDQSSPWLGGSKETHTHFSTPYEAFYVMPDGSVTPNLRSHVMFDKYLLSRLGVNPEALKEMLLKLKNAKISTQSLGIPVVDKNGVIYMNNGVFEEFLQKIK